MPSPFKQPAILGTHVPSGEPMAIAHELSSEIATALFTGREKSQGELRVLKKMVFEIHSTLEGLTERQDQKPRKAENDAPPLTRSFGSSI